MDLLNKSGLRKIESIFEIQRVGEKEISCHFLI